MLTQAFADDPVTAWCFPYESDRLERLGRFYAEIFLPRMALGRDEIYTDDGLRGVASWTPPGKGHMSPMENLRQLPRLAAVCGRGLPRAVRALSYLESQFPDEPHWHLPFLGVGTASARCSCARSSSAAIARAPPPTSRPAPRADRALYLRHGFVVLDEIRLPGGGPPLWRMWREPAV